MSQVLMTILSSGSINAIYRTLVCSAYMICVPIFHGNQVKVNAIRSFAFWLLYFFGLFYVVIGEYSLQGFEYYLITPLMAFTAGWCAAESKRSIEKTIKSFILAIVLGYGIHTILNISINIGRERWELQDYFSGQLRAATGSGCINTMIFALLAYIVFVERNRFIKVCGAALFIFSVSYAMILGTRTQFVILLTVNALIFIAYGHEKYGIKGVVRILLVFALIASIFLYCYSNNVFGIKIYIDSSNLAKRNIDANELARSDQYRTSSIMQGLNSIFEYPFGGLKSQKYYHNMWLDIGRVAGVIPFLLMVAYSGLTLMHVLDLFCRKENSCELRYLLLSIYLGVMLNFFVEPILEGLRDFFLIFCFINGMTECYCFKNKKRGYFQ